MATTTPNYGWAVPTSTDLVKDGATAIETLGDAIDASMNTALGTKKAGMVLLSTLSFNGVASQSINDVFSSTYDNYKIMFDCAGSDYINLRMRASGTDASGANYTEQTLEAFTTTVQGSRRTAQTSLRIGYATSQVEIYLYNPNKASPTYIKSNVIINENSVAFYYGAHTLSTAYTGFTFFPTSATSTGSLSVYGFNK